MKLEDLQYKIDNDLDDDNVEKHLLENLNKYIFISKEGEWYDEGTEVKFIAVLGHNSVLCDGIRNGAGDEELCHLSEFIVKEK